MAAKKKPAASSAASAPVTNEFTLGTPWAPNPALRMPDPNVPMALTEPGADNTLMAPDRSAGLGFSRYV
ncbi:MAG TPA: hypothetical protein VEF72_28045 [Mycobacterium sp.]|nr:hypothetical protein [Mycobacterium sp.]